jgi:hypothetical protein
LCFDHARGARMLLTRARKLAAASDSGPVAAVITGAATSPAATRNGRRTALIYGLIDPDEPDHVRYVGSTVQSGSARLAGHRSDAASAAVRAWRAEIAPREPQQIDLAVVDVGEDHLTAGGVAEGPVHDAEYAIVSALDALGHQLINVVGLTIARQHFGSASHQGGTHPSSFAGARAQRSGQSGNRGGRCAARGCKADLDDEYRIVANHYEVGAANGVVWRYCGSTCQAADQALIDGGAL